MLIVVEGCIGAGKSTVAKGLAAHRGSGLLLEEFQKNPFLSAFYEDPAENVVETEFSFLLLHYHQLKHAAKEIRAKETIADFHLSKDMLYAESNLEDPETIGVFKSLYDLLNKQTIQPFLSVFLSAPTDLIVERVRKRNRQMELKIDVGYFAKINASYEAFFQQYANGKMIVQMEEWDFVKQPELFGKLSMMIDAKIAKP